MVARHGSDAAPRAVIAASRRAIVLLNVPWSSPERAARAAFLKASERLAELSQGVECFLLGEEAATSQAWLSSLKIPQLGTGTPLGAGSRLWLERGNVVAAEIGGQRLGMVGILDRSRKLWG